MSELQSLTAALANIGLSHRKIAGLPGDDAKHDIVWGEYVLARMDAHEAWRVINDGSLSALISIARSHSKIHGALTTVVEAWNLLPEGQHRATEVATWLRFDMHPAIEDSRKALADTAATLFPTA